MSNPQPIVVNCNDAVNRVLISAEELFACCGYDAVSISAIADRARVSKANIFHHFQSKRALYITVLKGAAMHSTELLVALEGSDQGFSERLLTLMRTHLHNYLKHPEKSKLLMREVLENSCDTEISVLKEEFARNFSRVVSLIEAAQTAGEVRTDLNPAIVATTILAANIFYFRAQPQIKELAETGFNNDPDEYVDQVMELLLNGMLNRS